MSVQRSVDILGRGSGSRFFGYTPRGQMWTTVDQKELFLDNVIFAPAGQAGGLFSFNC